MFSLCARLAAGRHYLGRQLRHLLTDPSTWQHVPWCALSAACPVTCRPAVELLSGGTPVHLFLPRGLILSLQPGGQPCWLWPCCYGWTRHSCRVWLLFCSVASAFCYAGCQGIHTQYCVAWCGVLCCVVHCVECPWSCDYGVNGRLSLDRLLCCGGYLTHSHTLLMQFNTAGTCPDEVPRCSAALLPTHAAVLQEIRALVGQLGVEEVVS